MSRKMEKQQSVVNVLIYWWKQSRNVCCKIQPDRRFASEYGFQSWPSLDTLRSVSVPDEDWKLGSKWARHRQHHGNGTLQMAAQIERHFRVPKTKNETLKFTRTVYFSQVRGRRWCAWEACVKLRIRTDIFTLLFESSFGAQSTEDVL